MLDDRDHQLKEPITMIAPTLWLEYYKTNDFIFWRLKRLFHSYYEASVDRINGRECACERPRHYISMNSGIVTITSIMTISNVMNGASIDKHLGKRYESVSTPKMLIQFFYPT